MSRSIPAVVAGAAVRQLSSLRLRWLLLIAVALVSPSQIDNAYARAPQSSTPGLCIRSAVVHHDLVRVCRAVVGQRLYVFYFVRHDGVWFLIAARPASTLPKGPPS